MDLARVRQLAEISDVLMQTIPLHMYWTHVVHGLGDIAGFAHAPHDHCFICR